MARRKKKKHAEPEKRTLLRRITVPATFLDRLEFLKEATGAFDVEEVVNKAIAYYDRSICARREGSVIIFFDKLGRIEDADPCT